ncbi:MAG: hypothetical protein ABEI98_01860 [Halorhabdus sp.]
MHTPVDASGEPTYYTLIDQAIRSWLADAPGRLAADATKPFDADPDRFRGQFLLVGLAAIDNDRYGSGAADGPEDALRDTAGRERQPLPSDGEPPDEPVSAAASVEFLYGQALLNARAAGVLDARFTALDETRALLASDYLHSLAYASLARLDVSPSIGQACYESMATASRHLAACWTRLRERNDCRSIESVPIDPIVTATAGDLAGILGRADDDCRRALRTTGVVLGLARWQADNSAPEQSSDPLTANLPEDLRVEGCDEVRTSCLDELLAPLPESSALARLRTLADDVVTHSTDRFTHD